MIAFDCLIFLGLFLHLVSSDVSLTIGSNKQNARAEQSARSNYEAPHGYEYSGSYSTVAPDSNAKYVGSYSTIAPGSKAKYVSSAFETGAPEIKYVGSYTSGASAEYVGSYATVAPENKAQYVGSYSTVAPDNNAKYVSSFSSGASGNNKAQYVGSYSTVAPENKAQYVGSYSTVAPDNNAKYVGSYSTVAPDNNAKYVASFSSGASGNNKAQYVASYSTVAPETNAKYVGSYSTVAPDNNAKYVGSFSSGTSDNKAQYVGSYSSGASGNKAQYVSPSSSSSGSSYDSYASGQVSGNRGYHSAKQEYSPEYQNDRGVLLISKELQVPFATANQNEKSVGCDETDSSALNQQVPSEATFGQNFQSGSNAGQNVGNFDQNVQSNVGQNNQQVPSEGSFGQSFQSGTNVGQNVGNFDQDVQSGSNVGNFDQNVQSGSNVGQNVGNFDQNVQSGSNVGQNVGSFDQAVPNDAGQNDQNVGTVESSGEPATPVVYKTSKYEVRRPGIRKEFYDIEEKVVIKPAGHAVFELQQDKPHTSTLLDQHIYRQQSDPQYPQYPDDDYSQFDQEEQQQFANHAYHPGFSQGGYNPVIIQSHPSTGSGYNPVVPQSPPRPHVQIHPSTYNPGYPVHPGYPAHPGYPSTTVTSGYLPPTTDFPPCEDTPDVHSKPHPPSSHHELSDEYEEDGHDYDSDAAFITDINEDRRETADIRYVPSKSNVDRDREYYKPTQPSAYNPELRVDRLRVEYQNQRGDLAQLKAHQNPQQFHQEYIPNNVYVDQKQVQIRPNGAPFAKYTQDKAGSQVEIENSQKLLDLYSANGDVTELGFGGGSKSQQYKLPNSNVQARVVSVTPAPQYANSVDEQTKTRRVVLSKPLYTVQQVEVREHNHRLVEDADQDSVQPSVSEFAKLRLIGRSSYGKSSSSSSSSSASRKAEGNYNEEAEYVTPVPQGYGHLRAGAPVPDNLKK